MQNAKDVSLLCASLIPYWFLKLHLVTAAQCSMRTAPALPIALFLLAALPCDAHVPCEQVFFCLKQQQCQDGSHWNELTFRNICLSSLAYSKEQG